ncbi:hypothetical protein F5984_09320 [Rudanella paleaurantiibacter]|uniref:Repeat protein (TIGR03806 family) n=2 Tax=Rudanella paleaurantiibacter TaxID=2614655 RepID=A0A7J5U039_9BACT|nr:hypothetical protein F5984_09320 [Rudanella paleaurantiibacter]
MKNFRLLSLAMLLFSGAVFYACLGPNNAQTNPGELDFETFPLKRLSEYGFFKGNLNALQPNERVLVYEPIAPLFTDYAFKKRFVWMAQGTSATFDPAAPDEPLDFPDKAILVKNFYYPADFRKPAAERRILETRLLVKHQGTWKAYPYRWNAEQTDADYKVTGERIPVSWTDEYGQAHQIQYAMPNKNQCKSCHNRNEVFMPIGPKVKQLNHPIAYADGTENQLERWVKMGYLKATKTDIERISPLVSMTNEHASLNSRARSYLDVNCGHCHNPKGPAATSGLYLNHEERNPFHWGVRKSPVAAGIGAGSFRFDVNPGQGRASIMTYRMNSVHPGIMMPEVGRVSIHTEGVALIEAWINSLTP